MTRYLWADVAERLAAEPPGTRFRCARHLAEHPKDAGLAPSVDLPVGQRADFRGGSLRVQDFGTHYEACLDLPAAPPVSYAPTSAVEAGAALGGLVGLMLGRSRDSTLVGAALAAAFTADRAARRRR